MCVCVRVCVSVCVWGVWGDPFVFPLWCAAPTPGLHNPRATARHMNTSPPLRPLIIILIIRKSRSGGEAAGLRMTSHAERAQNLTTATAGWW